MEYRKQRKNGNLKLKKSYCRYIKDAQKLINLALVMRIHHKIHYQREKRSNHIYLIVYFLKINGN